MTELIWMSAARLARGYADGSLSPVEATRATLERIATANPRINAYCHVHPESALADARASEARWRAWCSTSRRSRHERCRAAARRQRRIEQCASLGEDVTQ